MSTGFSVSLISLVAIQSLIFGEWKTPQYIIQNSISLQNASIPSIQSFQNGEAVAVWLYYDGMNQRVQTSYTENKIWKNPFYLSDPEIFCNAAYPSLTINQQGMGVVIWQYGYQTETYPQVSNYDVNTGQWSGPISLNQPSVESSYQFLPLEASENILPKISNNNINQAIAIWQHKSNNLTSNIFYSTYNPVSESWSNVDLLTTNLGITNSTNPQISMNANQAIAVWQTSDTMANKIQSSTYSCSTNSWSLPGDIVNYTDGTQAAFPSVSIGDSSSIAVWQTFDGSTYNIEASRLPSLQGSWSIPLSLTSYEDGLDAISPKVVVNSQGNAIVIWTHSDLPYQYIEAAVYDATMDVWSNTFHLSSIDFSTPAIYPDITFDDNNNAVVVWMIRHDTTFDIQSSAYDWNTQTWSAPETILNGDKNPAYIPKISSFQNHSTVIWSRFDGTAFNIQSTTSD